MKFTFQELHDLTDAQRNFEQITAHGIDDATTLGGDLSGSLPKPTVPTVRGGLVPVARTDAAGGSLTGTYPNPTLSTATVQSFLQLLSAQNLKADWGSGTISAGIGPGTYTVTLANAFPTSHLVFLAGVNPVSSIAAGNYFIGSSPSSLSTGGVQLASSINQTWNYHYLAIGN